MSVVKNLIVRAGADFSGLQRGLQQAQNQLQTAGNEMHSSLGKIGGLLVEAFAVDKLVDFGKEAIEAGANVQAMNAQFKQVFGSLSNDATKTMNQLGKEFGMVPTRIEPALTQMTSMFKGLGMNTADAMGTAKEAVTAVADASAFYDMSFENANEALNSFIKGNYEGGEAIGLFANETQMASWASKNLHEDWKKLDEKGKQVARLKFAEAMQKASGAMGQASRESNSYENQLGNLKETWKQFLATIGSQILPSVISTVKGLASALQSLTPHLQKMFKQLSNSGAINQAKKAFKGLMDVLKWVMDNSDQVIAGISGILAGVMAFKAMEGIVKIYKAWQLATEGMTAAQWLLNIAMDANPLGMIALAIGAVVAGIVLMWMNWDKVSKWWKASMADLSKAWKAFEAFLSGVWSGISSGAEVAWKFVSTVAKSAWSGIQSAWASVSGWFYSTVISPVKGGFNSLWNGLKSAGSSAWSYIKSIFSGVGSWFVSNVVNPVKHAVANIASGVSSGLVNTLRSVFNRGADFINGAISMISHVPGVNIGYRVPHLAHGGITNGPMMAVIGDNIGGQEVVSPLDKLQGMLTHSVMTAMKFNQPSNNSNQSHGDITLNIDGRTFARVTRPYYDQESKRIGNNIRLNTV